MFFILSLRPYRNYCDKRVEIYNENDDKEGSNIIEDIYEKYEITGHKNDIILVADVCNKLSSYDKGKLTNELQNINVFKVKNRQHGDFYNNGCILVLKK